MKIHPTLRIFLGRLLDPDHFKEDTEQRHLRLVLTQKQELLHERPRKGMKLIRLYL